MLFRSLKLKDYLGWKEEPFTVPGEVKTHMKELINEGKKEEEEWNKLFEAYKREYPELGEEFEKWMSLELPLDYLDSDEFWDFQDDMATRKASGILINRIAEKLPNLIGGSADLAPSNNTNMKSRESFSKDNYSGSNMHFGIREHAMAGIVNGMNLHGGLRAFASTFFVFSEIGRASCRERV